VTGNAQPGSATVARVPRGRETAEGSAPRRERRRSRAATDRTRTMGATPGPPRLRALPGEPPEGDPLQSPRSLGIDRHAPYDAEVLPRGRAAEPTRFAGGVADQEEPARVLGGQDPGSEDAFRPDGKGQCCRTLGVTPRPLSGEGRRGVGNQQRPERLSLPTLHRGPRCPDRAGVGRGRRDRRVAPGGRGVRGKGVHGATENGADAQLAVTLSEPRGRFALR
jgi:hypothetical protein